MKVRVLHVRTLHLLQVIARRTWRAIPHPEQSAPPRPPSPVPFAMGSTSSAPSLPMQDRSVSSITDVTESWSQMLGPSGQG